MDLVCRTWRSIISHMKTVPNFSASNKADLRCWYFFTWQIRILQSRSHNWTFCHLPVPHFTQLNLQPVSYCLCCLCYTCKTLCTFFFLVCVSVSFIVTMVQYITDSDVYLIKTFLSEVFNSTILLAPSCYTFIRFFFPPRTQSLL